MHAYPILSIAIWLPILVGLLVLAIGSDRNPAPARWIALIGSVLSFIVTLPLITGFDSSTADLQFVEKATWIERFNITYHLGVDGISMWFVVLTALITVIVVIAGWQVITKNVAQYFASFLILSGIMIGVFSAADGLLFYVFFEATLIPMFIVIGVWGGPNRVYAALKFFLYTLLGSFLTLIAFIYLYGKAGDSFDILTWQSMPIPWEPQILVFIAFLIAFAVKVPMWPVHTWLPDAHVEAPTGGSVILAAIMLKMGGYGLLRFSLPITPDASHELDWLMIALSLIAIVYIAFVALVQQDMKKLVAYSSIAHMGFVTMGAFLVFFIESASGSTRGAINGLDGAMVQMVSHGLISGALFLCIGVLYDRMHTREISAYGGVINTMPKFAALMVLFALANSGLPGTSGFVGEFLVILASFKASFWFALLAATILVFGAVYNLWLVKRVVFGPVANAQVAAMPDLNHREFLVLGTLAAVVLLLGVWPAPMLNMMESSVQHLLQQLLTSKLGAVGP